MKVLKKLSRFIAGDLDVAADRRPGVAGRGLAGSKSARTTEGVERAHPVGVRAGDVAGPGVGHHADDAGDGVAAAQRVRGGQRVAAPAEDDRVGVLALQRVVEDDLVEVVGRLERDRRRARARTTLVGWCRRPPTRQRHLAEAAELEVLGDDEGLRQAHEHALVALEGGGARERQGRRRSGATRAGAAGRRRWPAAGEIWRLALELTDRPVTVHDVAERRRGRRCR